ncbi:MAG: hypothetical protein LBE33_01670 [Zoogloeaceae bacterium]|nr:hypothetical protein [Zoogloeaceae bacterium]
MLIPFDSRRDEAGVGFCSCPRKWRRKQSRFISWLAVQISVWIACLLTLSPAFAHEVRHDIEMRDAVAVRLTFADGQPFAFEAFEVYAAGGDTPLQVGRTDAQGRALFLPPASGAVRLRAFSADGHGVDLTFDPPRGGEAAPPPTSSSLEEGRSAKFVFGIGILLALFGIVQLFLRRKEKR